MPTCVDQFVFHISLKNGSVLVGAYLVVRSLVAMVALLLVLLRGTDLATGREVLWSASLFGVLVGPRLIYVVVQKIPRPIKNTAVWLVIYGVADVIAVLFWSPERWSGRMLVWTCGLVMELVLFFYFALVLWSYSVSVTSRKPPKREQLRMEVLKARPVV